MNNPEDIIVRDPKVMAGKPIIKGTRITVEAILDALASGMSIEEIAEDFMITTEEVEAAIEYAKKYLGTK